MPDAPALMLRRKRRGDDGDRWGETVATRAGEAGG
jgi:hypothetical protein